MQKAKELKVEYSPDVDALIITLSEDKPEYAEEIGSRIIIHYSKDSKPVEVEMLDASEILASSLKAVIRKARKS